MKGHIFNTVIFISVFLTSTALPLNARGEEIGTNDFRISSMGNDGDTTYYGDYVDIAYNSRDNEFLIVWHGDDNSLANDELEIWGQRIDAESGQLLGSRFRISDMGPDGNANYDAKNPAVAYNSTNNEYLVVWYGDDNTGALVDGEYEIWAQRIDASTGAEIGSDFRISDMGSSDGNTTYQALNPDVAYNSSENEYLVVWQGSDDSISAIASEYEIWGQRIDASTGAEIGGDFRISDMGAIDKDLFLYQAMHPAVAYNSTNNEYLVVWSGDDDTAPLVDDEFEIFGQRLNAQTGAEIGTNDFRISDMGPDGDTDYGASYPDVAYNTTNNEYIVVWEGDDSTINDYEIWSQRLNGQTGAEIGSDSKISSMGPDGNTAYFAYSPAVAYDSLNNEYYVVWYGKNLLSGACIEMEIWGQSLDGSTGAEVGTDDERLSDMGSTACDTNYGAARPAIAYNSHNGFFLTAWSGDNDIGSLADGEFEIWGQLHGQEADLSIVKQDDQDPINTDDILSYTITVTNLGPGTATGITVTDSIPNNTTFVSASGLGWTCSENLGTVTCTKNTLSPSGSSSISLSLSVNESYEGDITNTAIVTSNSFDGTSSNNADTEITTVIAPTPTPSPTPTPEPTPSPTLTPTPTPTTTPSPTCSLTIVSEKCRKTVRKSTRCTLRTSFRYNSGNPISGARYILQRKVGRKPYRNYKGGATEENGSDLITVKIKKTSLFRSVFSSPQCTTNEVRIIAKKKRGRGRKKRKKNRKRRKN